MEHPAGQSETQAMGIHALPKAIVDMLTAWDAESERLVVECRRLGPEVAVVGTSVPIS